MQETDARPALGIGSTFGSQLSLTRRALFSRIGGGFGALGLASVLADAGMLMLAGAAQAATSGDTEGAVLTHPLAPRPPHFPARAKRVIFLFMNGGPSHVDTFDPKPALQRYAGQDPPADGRDRPAQARQGHALAVLGPAARPERHRGDRALPARRRLHRRDLRDPLDVHRQPEPRAVALDDELGQHAADPAQPGLVADLRPGYREPEPARLRRPLSRQAGRRPAVVEQQLPARHLPGDAHPQSNDRSGPDHSRRHQPPPVTAPSSASSSTCSSR